LSWRILEKVGVVSATGSPTPADDGAESDAGVSQKVGDAVSGVAVAGRRELREERAVGRPAASVCCANDGGIDIGLPRLAYVSQQKPAGCGENHRADGHEPSSQPVGQAADEGSQAEAHRPATATKRPAVTTLRWRTSWR
jgi:hypothetical protein